MASDNGSSTPDQQVRQLYERAERDAAEAAERLVGSSGFVGALAMLTENVVALTRVGNAGLDAALRNLRMAGRRDLDHVAAQLVRTEDKLERVLQEVEALRDEVAELRAAQGSSGSGGGARRASGGRQTSRSGGSRGRGGSSSSSSGSRRTTSGASG